ncbi:Maf family protein [Hyphobacterium sp. HN65]|uniref:Nucleoside triphosphate pyrophosphatase n=1 Tax=Hyphobacterium lacteum TaxID=3116575 RepID=A0ABU7LRU1_9PROT|nr:Maf family protein [Hyphobacterium sp. HN65]MEE2526631.1 Maf family protein [Hyphobacterium sp. HN65]
MTRLILASGSQIRRKILENAKIPFAVKTSGVDEDAIKQAWTGTDPTELALLLAEAKAGAVSAESDQLVLGADQVLGLDGEMFDKAKSAGEARDRLLHLRGKTHTLHCGLAAVRAGEVIWRHRQESHLKVRDFSDDYLDHYLKAAGDVLTASVGAYAYEELGAQLFDAVDGDYYAILGLPLLPVLDLLRQEGVLER